jgi:hypothetical protein
MNEDAKPIYVASQQFSEALARFEHTVLYQASDRHGLFEWVAKVYLGDPWDAFVSLGMWEIERDETLGLQGSVAQVHGSDKYIRDFTEQASIKYDDYNTLEKSIQDVLGRALRAAKADLSSDPSSKLPEPYAFAKGPATA